MKTLPVILFIMAVAGMSCTQQSKQQDYKAVRDEVMKFHDVVMADHGVIVSNQMKLDTLLKDLSGLKAKFPQADTVKEKAAITALIADLTKAEALMNDWMHQFEPDVTGKSNEAAIQYFQDEKLKIAAVDSVYKKEIKLSGAYLSQFKK